MSRWRENLSIKWILPLAIVLPVFVVAVVLILLGYETSKRTANDLAGQNMRQIHQRIENHLTHLMDLPAAINRLNASRLRQNIISLDDPARSRKMMFETLQTFPDISSIVLGSEQGRAMWIIRYPGETTYEYAIKAEPTEKMREFALAADGRIISESPTPFEYNPAKRPWYIAAIKENGPTWSEVYVWVRGGKGETLGVSYVEPYRDEQGKLLGVIDCELTLSDISAFLSKLEIGKTGQAYIIDRSGNLVANSSNVTCMKNGIESLPANEAGDKRIAGSSRELNAKFGALKSINGQQRTEMTIDGAPMQVVVSSYQNRRNLDWLIVTLVPDSDFLADAQRSRTHSMLIGAGAVLLALVFGVCVAIWLLRPILAVVQHAKKVGDGDLDAQLDRHDNREIAQISKALNDMASGLKDRIRLRHALSLAMEVQQSLLPTTKPKIVGCDVAARSKYCDETGGDYYDYLDVEGVEPNTLFVALGDVMGHGIAAAMLMATARGILRSRAKNKGSLGELLTHVNVHLAADTRGKRFMTMFLGMIDTSAMTLRWATAGHDHPLVYDPETKKVVETAEGGGLPLGVMETEEYVESTYPGLKPGQVMLIGTDGLWESKNNEGELFGKERVAEAMIALAHLSAAEIEAGLYARLQEFCGGRANDDDITYVVIKFTAR